MRYILSEFLLICHYSLVFSLSVLCTVLFVRTRDKLVLRLLQILYPLFILALSSLYYYFFAEKMDLVLGSAQTAVNLFLVVLTCAAVPLLLYGTSNYLLSLLGFSEKRNKIGRMVINIYSLLFFLIDIYFIFFLHGDDWLVALSKSLNDLFLYGSMFLLLPAVAASFFLGKTMDSKKKQLLRGIMIAFYPIALLSVLDLLFFREAPYKIAYTSYLIFSILVYMYTSRQYVHLYDPENPILPGSNSNFYKNSGISAREQDLVPYLLDGKSNKDISAILYISPNTVKSHIRNIYKKVGVSNRLQLLSKINNHPEGLV